MLKTFDFEKLPIVEIVNEIIVDSVKRNASDIHFDPYDDFLKIRIRIDGELIDYSKVSNNYKRNLITRIKIISGMNITESRLPQDGAIKATLQNIDLDLRVSSLPTNKGEKIVIRILDYSMSAQGIENLGFSDTNFKKVKNMISVPNGIILVTGPTGSGKSTTVYSILQRLNKEDINIMTVEDPIEMDVEGINQIQVNSEIGLTFAEVLRSILRQDPNIIMIGEIRDTETAQIAVRASITGHLVLSTIHTNNSLNTIERLLDMDVERYLLGAALTGIVSQKLARKLCNKCKRKKKTTEYEKEIFRRTLGIDVNEMYVPGSCEECNGGYRGRIALQEVLLINEEIRDAITNNIKKEELRELVYDKTDTITMLQDGLIKVIHGITTLEEVLKLIEVDDNVQNHGANIKIEEILENERNANKNSNMNTDISFGKYDNVDTNNITFKSMNKEKGKNLFAKKEEFIPDMSAKQDIIFDDNDSKKEGKITSFNKEENNDVVLDDNEEILDF